MRNVVYTQGVDIPNVSLLGRNINNYFLIMKFKGLYFTAVVAGLFATLVLSSCGGVNRCSAQGEDSIALAAQKQPLRTRLLFAGDAMCHSPQLTSALCSDGSHDFKKSFAAAKPHFDNADVTIVNLETTISPDGHYSGYPTFSSPKAYAEALDWLGTDIALLANNHCCDRGSKGIHSTVATLDTLGIAHTGAFANKADYDKNAILRFESNGIKFALINYTYGTNGIPTPSGCFVNLIDPLKIHEDLVKASEGSDCIIACMHWGIEYQRQPSAEQLKLAEFLHTNGANIVIGSHPHVVQPYVATDRIITVYSLGNFVSNQRKRYTDGSILAEIEVEKRPDSVCRLSLKTIPIWVKTPGHEIVSSAHDSEVTLNEEQRAKYDLFLRDTEQLLKQGIKHQ